jgi:hypothetical protein
MLITEPPKVLSRLADTNNPFNLFHINSAEYLFISDDTLYGNNVIEFGKSKDKTSYQFTLETDNDKFKIKNTSENQNLGLKVSEDYVNNPNKKIVVTETSEKCDSFKLNRVNHAAWLINTETGLYLNNSSLEFESFRYPYSDFLFQIKKRTDGFRIRNLLSNNVKFLNYNNQGEFSWGNAATQQYTIQNSKICAGSSALYWCLDEDNTLKLSTLNEIKEKGYNHHFSIKTLENVYQLYNSNNLYLYQSSNTQSGNPILEASQLESINNKTNTYFTIKLKSDTSIIITCANDSNSDNIDVVTDAVSVQKWASDNSFFAYATLKNQFVPNHPSLSSPIPFTSKDTFRKFITEFLENSLTNNLIIYYAGHGAQAWEVVGRNSDNNDVYNVQHYLCILPNSPDWYNDQELTQDLDNNIPFGKRVYLIFDACHSEGDLNLWQLQYRFEEEIIGFFAANAEINTVEDSSARRGGLYTNAFLKYFKMGIIHYELAEKILEETFTYGTWPSVVGQPDPISSAIDYSKPSLCVGKFCK